MTEPSRPGKTPADLTAGHTVRRYDRELAKLRGIILTMGDHVVEQTQAAVAALVEREETQAFRVLDREPQVDYLSLDADEEAFRVIIRHQPTAVDLRIVLALSKIAAELERAGDKAARIARQALELAQLGRGADVLAEDLQVVFRILDDEVCCMLGRSIHAVRDFDVAQAVEIFENEPALQDAAASVRKRFCQRSQDGLIPHQSVCLLTSAHALERIGNHASNIAEQVVYVALGQDVRYRNREILIETLRHHGY